MNVIILVVEIVSDSSVGKDLCRLPSLYAEAGIREFWLVDACGERVDFEVRHLINREWRTAAPDDDGFVESRVLSRQLRILRKPGPAANTWLYSVDDKPLN